ncbi:hypothetical protein JB92DRAFT_2260160 [Gautieria morchelliformis]|nr:hypothetical protein JB92DRAFT_2260160 [Gautieria morchelliformis]
MILRTQGSRPEWRALRRLHWLLTVAMSCVSLSRGDNMVPGDRLYHDGRYFVLAERHKSKDTLGVYDALDSYKLARHVLLSSSSLSSISLSPTDHHLAVWEGPLEYKLYILTLAGHLLATFVPEQEPALGIRSVVWHPSGSFLAVAGYDDKIHILNSLSWTSVKTLDSILGSLQERYVIVRFKTFNIISLRRMFGVNH